jgi:hypothetical protein
MARLLPFARFSMCSSVATVTFLLLVRRRQLSYRVLDIHLLWFRDHRLRPNISAG